MKIAVDVDGVLAEQVEPVIQRLNHEYQDEITGELDRPVRRSDIQSWNESIPGTETNIKIEIERTHGNYDYLVSMPTIDGAKNALTSWDTEGDTVKIVTDRSEDIDDATIDWLNSKSIPYDEYINTNSGSKAETNAEVLIDDYQNNIIEFAESGRPAILFVQPWNESTLCQNHAYIHTARNWEEVKKVVREEIRG